jgi:predicted unusual protein kinase regulating ubiquinone biosynthesis (AarF/ABC1/UbiB family)
MGLSIAPDHLKRYAGLARLLYKYGNRDLVERAGLEGALAGDDEPQPASARAATELAADLERMGPTYIKLGQLLSTRADLLPSAYLEALSRLQDDVEPFSFSDVEAIVQEELGVRMSKGFGRFDPEPIAAASLGQVHRATLRDGREVAVKVQRPDARSQVTQDLSAFAEIADFLDRHTAAGRQNGFAEVVEEFRKTIIDELDYRREAQNLRTLRANLEEFKLLFVPAPIDDYSTGRVLTMEFVTGRKLKAMSPVMRVDLDGAAYADQLLHAYLKQIIIDGFFHADPHPGNVLLTDDGRLALIDLGMVSRLAATRQEQLMKLLLAVAEGRGDDAAIATMRIGRQLENVDREAIERDVSATVVKYRDASLRDIQAGAVLLEISRTGSQHGLRLPSELALLAKTLLNLDDVGRTLAPDFDVNECLRRHATSLMQQRMRRSLSLGGAFTSMLELKTFVEALPARLNRLMDAASNNELKIKMEVIDEGALIEGFQKIANRIALGLILAALIVGAAMLSQVPTTFTLFGYPGLAMLLFLVAASGGIWLALSILTSDRKRTR